LKVKRIAAAGLSAAFVAWRAAAGVAVQQVQCIKCSDWPADPTMPAQQLAAGGLQLQLDARTNDSNRFFGPNLVNCAFDFWLYR
jgi:hypothetical protein